MNQEKQIFGVVYCVTNAVNGRQYIGITTGALSVRWKGHVADARAGSKRSICAAIREFGADAFGIVTIASATGREELGRLEKRYIAEYGTMHPAGYNLIAGNGGVACLETRQRMSAAKKGKKMSAAFRAKMSALHKGSKRSAETKAKMSAASKGRIFSPEHRAKIGANSAAHRHSAETKARLSRAVIADGAAFVSLKAAAEALGVSIATVAKRCAAGRAGYSCSRPAEKRVKMSEARRAAIIERESHPVIAEGKFYPSLTEAAAALGITRPGVAYRIKIGRQGYALADALKVAA